MCNVLRCTYLFQNYWEGGGWQQTKSAQGTIEIHMKSDFSSNLIPFLTKIGG